MRSAFDANNLSRLPQFDSLVDDSSRRPTVLVDMRQSFVVIQGLIDAIEVVGIQYRGHRESAACFEIKRVVSMVGSRSRLRIDG